MNEITDIQMSYEGLVEAGREARKQIDGHQWTEGDLALQVESLPSGSGPRDPETGAFIEDPDKSLKRYAEDIDMSYNTLRVYRRTAELWPVDARASTVGHKVHEILAAQEDRFDLIHDEMTVAEARAIVRKRNQATYHPPGWFELMGEAADLMIRVQKQLDKLEGAITRKPNADFRKRAGRYAGIAEDIADRLHKIENWDD